MLSLLPALLLSASLASAAGVISGNDDEEGGGGGDVQVGVDVGPPSKAARRAARAGKRGRKKPAAGFVEPNNLEAPSAAEIGEPTEEDQPQAAEEKPPTGGPASLTTEGELSRASQVPGIYPVFTAMGRWMLVERQAPGLKPSVGKGSRLVVIGSKGTAVFTVDRATRTYAAACENRRQAPRTAWYLTSKSAKNFEEVGTPIIAIRLKAGADFDPKAARFYRLKNEVKEDTYAKLAGPIKAAVAQDLRDETFRIKEGDEVGARFAQNPDPEKVQMKIDFGSRIRYKKVPDAFLLIEGTQVSNSYRRCMRLFGGNAPVGVCAQMPHELSSETRQLNFVAYDPSRSGLPFVLAYSEEEPYWGHERWGFQMTEDGPRLFLRDALDPRCREFF